jgi:small ligand-binding sensory domain FIST
VSDFLLAHAAGLPAQALAAACSDQLRAAKGHAFGFVYATSPLSQAFPEIINTLQKRTGIQHWVGTVGHGICATGVEYFDQQALVVLTCGLDAGACRFIPAVTEPHDTTIAVEIGPDWPAAIGVVHADPRNPAVTAIVTNLARRCGAYLVGGLTSAQNSFPQVAGSRIVDGGVSGVLLGGGCLRAVVGLTQGCSPIGPPHSVSRSQGQILFSLDERPAFDVLREEVGATANADPRRWLANIHAAIPVVGSDRADYVVRNIVGIAPEHGLVAIADTIGPSDRVMFVRRDADNADRDLQRMLTDLKSRSPAKPTAGLYFSCLARGPNLFPDNAHELKAIQKAFGDVPIVGFFGNGEIAHDRLYGYTGVLILLI